MLSGHLRTPTERDALMCINTEIRMTGAHLIALSLKTGSSYESMSVLNFGDFRRASRLGSVLTLLNCSNPALKAASSASRPASTCIQTKGSLLHGCEA